MIMYNLIHQLKTYLLTIGLKPGPHVLHIVTRPSFINLEEAYRDHSEENKLLMTPYWTKTA